MAQICFPSYTIEAWHTSLLMLGISVCNTVMGIYGNAIIERANTSNFVLNVATFIVIFLVLLIETGKKHGFNDAHDAFIAVPNESGWRNKVIPWMASLSSVAYATCAYDATFHFASEMRYPERSAPIAAVAGLGLNCATTLVMALALIFCMPPADDSLANAASGSAFTQLMLNKTGSVAGTTVIIVSIVIPYWLGGVDGNMACARIMWGMANRGGLPKIFGAVNKKWDAPWFSLIVVTAIQAGLAFINCGSDAAFSAFISAPFVCLGVSYIWVSWWMLTYARPKLNLRPSFKLGPVLGPACNIMTIVFVVCLTVFLCLPPEYPVTPVRLPSLHPRLRLRFRLGPPFTDNPPPFSLQSGMNYTSVIIVAFLGMGPFFWLFYGRKHYRGPIPEGSAGSEDCSVEADKKSALLLEG